MDAQNITTELARVGLNNPPGYWVKVFREELGITSKAALQLVGGESYANLGRFTNHAWEKKALRQLLNIEEEENDFKKQHDEQKKKLMERYEEAHALLEELSKLNSENKDRHDKRVQEIENGIRERLQIPSSAWISKDKSLEELITQLQSAHGNMSGALKQREDISDSALLRSASGGRALMGILLTEELEDQLKVREGLLKVPEDVQLMGSFHPQHDKVEQFFVKHQEDSFKKTVDILGYGAAMSAKTGFWGIYVKASVAVSKNTEEERTSEQHVQEMYSSTLKYSSMPLASFAFSDSQFQLTNDALNDLKDIETLISSYGPNSSNLHQACEQFFHKFGSHVNRGPLHFGGLYWWKCTSKGFKHSETSSVKDLQSLAVSGEIGVSHFIGSVSTSMDFTKGNAKYTGNCLETTISRTRLEVSKTGGPPEVCSFPEWKAGLVASNSTWCLIDRGTTLLPVWEIITMNHERQFLKARDLAQALKKAWKVMTNLSVKEDFTTISYSVSDVTAQVSKWSASKDMSLLQEQLQYLIEVKEDLIKQSMNPQAWPGMYLSQPPLQQFLKSVMDTEQHSSTSSAYIKLLMQQLVERTDLNAVRSLNFPHRSHISRWLYGIQLQQQSMLLPMECKDFLSLGRYLEQALENMNEATARDVSTIFDKPTPSMQLQYSTKATTAVTRAINLLRNNLLASGQKYEDLFILTLIFPFTYSTSYQSVVILKPLSVTDLKYLCNQFSTKSEEFFKLKEISPPRMQAFLFHLAVHVYLNESHVDVSSRKVRKHLIYMKDYIGELDSHLADILTMNLSKGSNIDWEQLKLKLFPMVTAELLQQQESGYSVDDILDEVKKHDSIATIQSEAFNERVSDLQDSSEASTKVHALFTLLNLHECFPQKLTLCDALSINIQTLETSKCTDPSKLCTFLLQKVMAHDYQCRTNLLGVPDHEATKRDKKKDELFDMDDGLDKEKESIEIHPMDMLLALIHCADDFLRQDLLSRLATCQLSIPIVLPDPYTSESTFLLWAMRSIVKEWRSTLKGKEEVQECPLVSYPTPIVAFIRFSRQEKSKSKIMNEVISDTNHDHFFHRDCEGGTFDRLLGDGLIEVCWSLPAGKPNDIFPDAVAFLNLHGNAQYHPQQTALLSEMCFMTFALFIEEDINEDNTTVLKQLSTAPGGVVMLLCKPGKSGKLKELSKAISSNKLNGLKLMTRNADEIKAIIRHQINKKLQEKWADVSRKMRFEHCTEIADKYHILVDESKADFIKGQKMAHELQEILTNHCDQNCSAKEKMLPLQGENLWHEWAKQDKEEHRQINRGRMKIEEYSSQKQMEKKMIRKLQLQHAQKLSPLMASFITILLKSKRSVRKYFLQCLKLCLNNLSRDSITLLQNKYIEKRSKLLNLQYKKEPNKRAMQECKQEIAVLHQQMIDASLGLEHLLRELGQLYEALRESPMTKRGAYSRLPQIAAELLIDGYPLELMDGDTAHVPKEWVTAVLQEAVKILHNPKVFVLSVLGLQSTGKSTLMNTVFGLQFNVGAGRCTRGAFMQLLPISDELRKTTNCDYMLVVDTEGLRAPELDSQKTQKHDNELATFVMGLANITMINIYGEVPGDMDDILQTTFHALLRMRHVKLNPSCQFVHQNVGAILAFDKGVIGRYRFKDKLDKMTYEAAKEENCEREYQYFSDVIKFDSEKDVHYFPGLWKGDPPMAPVNAGYSEKAASLKLHLVNMVMKSNIGRLTDTEVKIRDLWNALLHENFVFSFKNTLEITVYNILEAEYIQWAWDFKSRILEWEQSALTEIKNADRGELQALEKRLLATDLRAHISGIHGELENKMARFFEENDHRDMLAQWQAETKGRLKRLAKELESGAEQHCQELVSSQQARENVKKMNTNYQAQVMENVKTLVSTLDREELIKGQKSKEEIEEKLKSTFDEQWVIWIQELAPVHWEEVHVVEKVQDSLTEFFRNEEQKVIRKLQAKSLLEWGGCLQLVLNDDHFALKKQGSFTQLLGRKPEPVLSDASRRAKAESTKQYAFDRVKDYLESRKGKNFHRVYTYELLGILKEAIDGQEYPDFVATREYNIDMSLTACGFAAKQFIAMVETFRRQNDPIVCLEEEMKSTLFSIFKNQYLRTAGDKAAACTLCDRLVISIERQVMNSIGPLVFQDTNTLPCFANKSALKAKVLIDLGEDLQAGRCGLKDFFLYLESTESSLKKWTKHYTKEHCQSHQTNQQSRLIFLVVRELKRLLQEVRGKVHNVMVKWKTKVVTVDGLNTKEWVHSFCTNLKRIMEVDVFNGFEDLGGIQKLMDIENFTQEVQEGLRILQRDLEDKFQSISLDILDTCQNKPYDLLYNQLRGCCEQCPFCGEQCDCSNDGHDIKHSVQQHRPQCLGGYRFSKNKEMVTDVCSSLVGGDGTFQNSDTNDELIPDKDYQKIYPRWSIPINMSAESSSYWKWFVGHYSQEIAEHFAMKAGEVPSSWRGLTWEAVKKEVQAMYRV